ncbi:MAG: glycosyltransferase family 9 protein [Alphaproteobacteria bacterium]|nr:glycosyltransferase family 9 protein [Alphaproteobacteria bacterium]
MARSTEIERKLDRYVGIALVGLAGAFHRRRQLPAMPRRIGILQPTAIGDLILNTGLLAHLRHCFPQAELHVFHGPTNTQAVALLPLAVTNHCCNFKDIHQIVTTLRLNRLDILIDCTSWSRLMSLVCHLSGAKTTVGFLSPGQHRHFCFDIAVPYSGKHHEVENLRALAGVFGPIETYVPTVRQPDQPPPMELPYPRLVLMHVAPGGSRARQKSWPTANWANLARNLVERGWVVAFSGVDRDQDTIAAVLAAANLPESHCFSLAGRLSLAELAYALIRIKIFITVDTGVSHLATALNCNVIGLHGPTRFNRWGAIGSNATGLDAPHPDAGYINHGYERHARGDEIMASLSLDTVLRTVLERLGSCPADTSLPAPESNSANGGSTFDAS